VLIYKSPCGASIVLTNAVTPSRNAKNRHVTQAEAEAEAEVNTKDSRANESPQLDEQWLSALSKDPTYEGIDVMREFGKCRTWCESNKKTASRRRFTNWLNRAERPMKARPADPYANGATEF